MIDFKSIYFGCTMQTQRLLGNPKVFKKVFYDPHNFVNELVMGIPFVLMGRKGDGKNCFFCQNK